MAMRCHSGTFRRGVGVDLGRRHGGSSSSGTTRRHVGGSSRQAIASSAAPGSSALTRCCTLRLEPSVGARDRHLRSPGWAGLRDDGASIAGEGAKPRPVARIRAPRDVRARLDVRLHDVRPWAEACGRLGDARQVGRPPLARVCVEAAVGALDGHDRGRLGALEGEKRVVSAREVAQTCPLTKGRTAPAFA